jgi:hypothetical protein
VRSRSGFRSAVAIAFALACIAASTGAGVAQSFDHAVWSRIVGDHVVETGVRYDALRQDRALLDEYVGALAAVDSAAFAAWPRDAQVAYLINAYNALVVLQVVDAYPLRRDLLNPRGWFKPGNSVWQVPGFFNDIRHRVAGRDMTLDDIEHVWLRDRLAEPRIHFALVCAAESCPPFRTEAYVAERLDAQLDDQADRFFNDGIRNVFDRSAEKVRLSSILDWFGSDFVRFAPPSGFLGETAQRGALAFASEFLPPDTAEWLRTGDYTVDYIAYDWTLNDASRRVARR